MTELNKRENSSGPSEGREADEERARNLVEREWKNCLREPGAVIVERCRCY